MRSLHWQLWLQKEDFMQHCIIHAAIDFLNNKQQINKHNTGMQALLSKTTPPNSLHIKTTITSSKKEVVASEAFAKLVTEFDTVKAALQAAGKDLFIKMKNLDLETAKKDIKNLL